ncbi:ATP synthase subunit O, mitochondrial [Ischnura elegans]|uniref:ATP synthase subunit O, mitochondrial n=1 Tax=Ischnura elegans TaxID=197161 RepID=UPI001ED8A4CF|nr:ATP synthase subunit O, mitochondrial [Ischnura elegans]
MAAARFSVISRSISTSSSVRQLVKPPIQVFGIEGRYATALYSAATKQKQLEQTEKELVKFQATLKSDVKLKEFIANPTMKKALKAQAMSQVAKAASLSPLAGNLLVTMADNGRLKKLDGVINAFKVIMASHRGEVHCEVITAKPLDEASKKDLEGALKAFMKKGETILLTMKVQPEIIGGMIVSIGDKYVDMSIATKVKKMTDVISMVA